MREMQFIPLQVKMSFIFCTMCTKKINAEQKPHSNPADWYAYVVNTIFQNKEVIYFF